MFRKGFYWLAVCLEIEAYLVFNNSIPEHFHKLTNTMHIHFTCLVASSIGIVGYDQQLIFDTLKSPEVGLMEVFAFGGQMIFT